MKHKNNNQNEIFFKNLASSYAEKSGSGLKKELANLNSSQSAETSLLDTKVKNKVQTNKIKKWTSRLLPIAACFIFLMISYNILRVPMKSYDNAPNYNYDSDSDSNDDEPNEFNEDDYPN